MADNDALSAALGALEIGVFRQDDGGGFVSVGPVPAWMAAFSRNQTFPFLGSFLARAREFWREPQTDRLTWGPCAEMDTQGREFHFLVSAFSLPGHKLLVFELDRSAAQMRDVLQKARDQALGRAADATRADDVPTRPPGTDEMLP
jgi:hypothetical protein